MILCDSSVLIAFLDQSDRHHQDVQIYADETLVVPTTVLCEVDYMIAKYLGESLNLRRGFPEFEFSTNP